MKSLRLIIASALTIALLASCATSKARLIAEKDPYRKLAQARESYEVKARPVAADRLLHEAMTIFEDRKDEQGMAVAYSDYARLLQSPAIGKRETEVRKNGFLDKSVTFENRYQKSVEYFDKAADLFFKQKRFDALTSASTDRGIVLANLNRRDEACASFDQSISFHDETLRRNPATKSAVPTGYNSWNGYISSLEKWAGCGS